MYNERLNVIVFDTFCFRVFELLCVLLLIYVTATRNTLSLSLYS
jgi:hypothetical protein